MRKIDTASGFADRQDWDGRFFLVSVGGKVLWETAAHTSRGDSIRLMRLDNKTLRVYRVYVPLDYGMKLVEKIKGKGSIPPAYGGFDSRQTTEEDSHWKWLNPLQGPRSKDASISGKITTSRPKSGGKP